jgi:hypothetical protein
MFAQRLARHSLARITRALNDASVPCPSAANPARNPHRSGSAWTLTTVAILSNPRYTGRQVWNRQRTDHDLIDPANTTLGHRQVQRWNLPAGWVTRPFQDHDVSPRMVKGRSILWLAQRVASVVSNSDVGAGEYPLLHPPPSRK